MSKQTLTITDNRTGQTIELPIEHDTIPAIGLRQLKVQADDFGMMAYDPGYTNTASCKSRITYVDGDRGILRYRGYPIEQLAEKSTFLEVAHLLLFGELPAASKLTDWNARIMAHTHIDKDLKGLLKTFRADAHPMGILISAVAAMSTLYRRPSRFMTARIGCSRSCVCSASCRQRSPSPTRAGSDARTQTPTTPWAIARTFSI